MPSEIKPPALSVVILCYRSEESIIPFVQEVIEELGAGNISNYELILVANYHAGTLDRTPEIVTTLAESNSKLVPIIYEKNKGMMGWDVCTGLAAAKGDSVALIDGDGQMPPRDIIRLYKVLQSGEFDLVKTYRTKRLDGFRRKLISRSYNILFRIFFPSLSFRDINSKPKIWARKALEMSELKNTGWFIDGEIMLEAHRLNFSVAEIPTVFHENEWRASFVGISTIFELIFSLIQHRFIYWFRK